MNIHRPDPHAPRGGTETPRDAALSRRRWLRLAGFATGGALLAGGAYQARHWWRGADEEVLTRGMFPKFANLNKAFFPARLDERYEYQRPETLRPEAARYTNFYEFSSTKSVWRFVRDFEPLPWKLTIDGLCRTPQQWDLESFLRTYRDQLIERQYRHRCVEKWAMCIPWTGVPLTRVLQDADPLATATHVRFVSFERPDQAPPQQESWFPWPYTEGLTIAEARIDLVLLAVGMYGEPLLKQHGAPLRLVVPWKYGYKSIKSIERIELVARQPATFWNTVDGSSYSFESNVNPDDVIPWAQDTERMLGTGDIFPTQLYNGYAQQVAHLYPVP